MMSRPEAARELMNKKSGDYKWFVYHGMRFREAKGIVVNTFEELESGPLRVLDKGMFVPQGQRTPPIYPVGPVLCFDDDGDDRRRHECVKWLDEQPPASVVFLCFGSKGCFSDVQAAEMAAGLEQSGHRFLWILRSPSKVNANVPVDANLYEALPNGFLDRTRERGMVWPSWAPQTKILSHKSIGGFVTHCGWNSCQESLWFGVPMLAWPLYAEQHLNDVEMVRDVGIAVGLKADRKKGNFVTAAELERGVRCLMGDGEEGRRVRARVEEMKMASRKAVEKGGSSYNYMEKLARELVG